MAAREFGKDDTLLNDVRRKIDILMDTLDRQNKRMDNMQRSLEWQQQRSRNGTYQHLDILDDDAYYRSGDAVPIPDRANSAHSPLEKKPRMKMFCIN